MIALNTIITWGSVLLTIASICIGILKIIGKYKEINDVGTYIYEVMLEGLSKLGKLAHKAEIAEFAGMLSYLLELDIMDKDFDLFRQIKADVLATIRIKDPDYKMK